MLRGATQSDLAPMRRIDLTKGDVLYPLGWYLSPTAREGMERAASEIEPLSTPALEQHGPGPSSRF